MPTLTDLGLKLPPETRGFRHLREGGLLLVVPGKGQKMRYRDWAQNELPFRSLVIRDSRRRQDHEILSVGFPKFFNWGEAMPETEQVAHLLARGSEVLFTEKLDGSLVVRSVIDGQVRFRTRGRLDLGDFAEIVDPLVLSRYPHLLDPDFRPTLSLLFELTSPRARIVVPYRRDDLTLIGAVKHRDLKQLAYADLARVATEAEVPLVSAHDLPRDHEALVQEIAGWKDREGVVLRAGSLMLKLKADDYLTRHRLRFALSARAIREVCIERDVRDLSDFEDYLQEHGADWELVSDARVLVEAFLGARAAADQAFAAFETEVSAKALEFPDRKDFALHYATALARERKSAAFALLDDRREQALALLLSAELDRAFDLAEERDLELEEVSA